MNSPRSPFERRSRSLDLLAPGVVDWIRSEKWPSLRDIQERAIPILLEGNRDLIVSAPTASGKTEAAFLPILSAIESDESAGPGIKALYLGPLKALINDQCSRFSEMCRFNSIAVTPWHGDVPQNIKKKIREAPDGVLLITPESLEAQFCLRGAELRSFFAPLRYIVIDEIHTFVGQERGRQLQSQMTRLELLLGRRIPRVGLSATIGDMALVRDFLRRNEGGDVEFITPEGTDRNEVQLKLRGYISKAIEADGSEGNVASDDVDSAAEESDVSGEFGAEVAITQHLFRNLRGHDNLVFANSRTDVEKLSERLRRLSDDARVPVEFFPHHGNLDKSLREDLERRLKADSSPVTAVCTTTLEMGIDIGDVVSVAQVGPPASVASFTQRLGRSGRRAGAASIMRMYVSENELTTALDLRNSLRLGLVQSIAVVNLMIRGEFEPPQAGQFHLSTLVQQVLSLIAQLGSVTPVEAHRVLCVDGPFREVSRSLFVSFLRCLKSRDLIAQMESGELTIGLKGESLIGHYDFYAAFSSSEDYQVRTGNRVLGALPAKHGIMVGDKIIFAGRCWEIENIDDERRVLIVKPHAGAKLARFAGEGPLVDEIVRREMESVLRSTGGYPFLNPTARELLGQARLAFVEHGLHERAIVPDGKDVHVVPFAGDLAVVTLNQAIHHSGIGGSSSSIQGVLTLRDVSAERVAEQFESWNTNGFPSLDDLVRDLQGLSGQKHDHFLSAELRREAAKRSSLHREFAMAAVARMVASA